MPPTDAGVPKKKSSKGTARGARPEPIEAPPPSREPPTKRGAGFAWLLTPHPGKLRFSAVTRGGSLGRAADNAIVVDGPGISPTHAQVEIIARAGVSDPAARDGENLEIYITDAGTSAGSYVGGMRTQRTVLHDGDILRLGNTLALVIERDVETYDGNVVDEGGIVRGPRSRKTWFALVERACAETKKESRTALVAGLLGSGRRTVATRIVGAWSGATASGVNVPTIDLDCSVERVETGLAALKKSIAKSSGKVIRVHAIERATPAEVELLAQRPSGSMLVATADSAAPLAPAIAAQFEGAGVHRIDIPSIEDRREEIPTLIKSRFERHKISGHQLSVELYEALTRAAWPGEIAELCEVVDAIAAAHPDEARLGPEHLTRPLARRGGRILAAAAVTAAAGEAERIRAALIGANGSVAAAARTLQLSRQALYREAARLGIDIRRARDGSDGPVSER